MNRMTTRSMKDLLGDTPYPESPGWKARDTSKAAAGMMARVGSTLRADVLRTIQGVPEGMTADECAGRLSQSVLTIRPRVAELAAKFQIIDSGTRRKNISGRSAIVWRGSP